MKQYEKGNSITYAKARKSEVCASATADNNNDKPNEMLEKKKEYSRDPRLNVKIQDVNVHCKKK